MILIFLNCFTAQAIPAEVNRHTMDNLINNYIIPAHIALSESAHNVYTQVNKCSYNDGGSLHGSREAFNNLVRSWAAVEWFNIGPVMRNNRKERFFLFPDRKNKGLYRVRRAIQERDRELLDVETLQRKSVDLQGLRALEYLLFSNVNNTIPDNVFVCSFAISISKNLTKIADAMLYEWQNDSHLIDLTGVTKASPKDDIHTVLGIIIRGLEDLHNVRIRSFLRDTATHDRPYSAPFNLSKNTIFSIYEAVQSIEVIFSIINIGKILPEKSQYIEDNIRFDLSQIIMRLSSLQGIAVEEILGNAERRRQLVHIQLNIRFLMKSISDDLYGALGFAAGFSFVDGD